MPTPAMAAGLTIKLMSMEDVGALSLRRSRVSSRNFGLVASARPAFVSELKLLNVRKPRLV